MTTFHGHANVYGTSEAIDFRIGHPGVTAASVFRDLTVSPAATAPFVSYHHGLPAVA